MHSANAHYRVTVQRLMRALLDRVLRSVLAQNPGSHEVYAHSRRSGWLSQKRTAVSPRLKSSDCELHYDELGSNYSQSRVGHYVIGPLPPVPDQVIVIVQLSSSIASPSIQVFFTLSYIFKARQVLSQDRMGAIGPISNQIPKPSCSPSRQLAYP